MESQLNIIRGDTSAGDVIRPPVLLVHGAWHGAWCWQDNFLDYFAANGFETSAVDLRGHGGSAAQKAMRWNRISDYVDDVVSVVEGFEQPPIVIGHSMGGFICQHLMARTNHLSGVGLLASVPHFGVWDATIRTAKAHPLNFLKANLKMSLYPLVSDPNEAVLCFWMRTLSRLWAMLLQANWATKLILVFWICCFSTCLSDRQRLRLSA